MRAQDDDDIGSLATMRADLMKAVGDAQSKSTDTQRFQDRSARNTVIAKKQDLVGGHESSTHRFWEMVY
jgi:hypothetical protein